MSPNAPKLDGRTYPYVPPRQPPEEIRHLLDEEWESCSATDFEVLRHALWNANLEHGQTIIRTSGSPVVVHSHDFNPVLMDEWGDHVYFGPWLQYLTAAASTVVKWVLEYRRDSPGIARGSMFITNDPWIGAVHQQDLALVAPIFNGDKIFAWVGNSLHHADLGGTAPGGFNPIAEDVFWESGVIPPLRIVENGEIRADIQEEFMRRSRMPELAAVDLRGQIAGAAVAVQRLQKLVDKYGAAKIKGVMRKIQDDAEASFARRLDTVPDGEWSAEGLLEAAHSSDRGLYRNRLTLRKEGGRLVFSNHGTDPQTGALNCTYVGFTGAVSAMVNSQLMFDQVFAIGGALRRIDFEIEHGTLTSALHPAALSLAPMTVDQLIALTASVMSKMLSCSRDRKLHAEIQSAMGSGASFPLSAFNGVDKSGRPFASLVMDPVGCGMAAWSGKDGLDVGGWPWDPQVAMPNVEEQETFYPLLYLWRRITPDSGGAGEYRGGNSMDLALLPHGVDKIHHHTASSACHAVPAPPIFGGFPSNMNRFVMLRETNVAEMLHRGTMPGGPDDIAAGRSEELPPKSFGTVQGTDDVYVVEWAGAGGLGDPLDRPVEKVVHDVASGMVTEAAARAFYGVVVSGGGLDVDATDRLRNEIRESRRSWEGPREITKVAAGPSEIDQPVGPGLQLRSCGTEHVMACGRCDTVLSAADQNWKSGALTQDVPATSGNLHIPPPERLVDDPIVIRQFACPGCLRLLANDVLRAGEESAWDIRITTGAH